MMWIVWVIGAVWMVGCMALIWEARRTPITPSDYANEPRADIGSRKAEQHTVYTDTIVSPSADSEYVDSERKEDNLDDIEGPIDEDYNYRVKGITPDSDWAHFMNEEVKENKLDLNEANHNDIDSVSELNDEINTRMHKFIVAGTGAVYPAAYVERLHDAIAELARKLQAADKAADAGIGFYNGRTDTHIRTTNSRKFIYKDIERI